MRNKSVFTEIKQINRKLDSLYRLQLHYQDMYLINAMPIKEIQRNLKSIEKEYSKLLRRRQKLDRKVCL